MAISITILEPQAGRFVGQVEPIGLQWVKSATPGDVQASFKVRRPSATPYTVGSRVVIYRGLNIVWQGIISRVLTTIDYDEVSVDGDGKRLADLIVGGDTDLSMWFCDNRMTIAADTWQQNIGTNADRFTQDANNRLYVALQPSNTYASGDTAGYKYVGLLGSERITRIEIDYTCSLPLNWTAEVIEPLTGTSLGGLSASATLTTAVLNTAGAGWTGASIRLRATAGSTPGGNDGDYFIKVVAVRLSYVSSTTGVQASTIAKLAASNLNAYTLNNNDAQGIISADLSQIQNTATNIMPAVFRYISYAEMLRRLQGQGLDAYSYSGLVLADAPYLYYRMDAAVGVGTETDLGSGAHNGTYTGLAIAKAQPGLISGDSDTAIRLNGTASNYLASGGFAVTNSSLTVEAWVMLLPTVTGQQGVIGPSSATPPGATHDRDIYIDTFGIPHFYVFNGSAFDLAGTADIRDGKHHHIVGRVDSATTKTSLWVDGVKVTEQNNGGASAYTANFNVGVSSGGFAGGGPFYFNGWIDEVAYYTTALPDERIKAHWQAPPPLPIIYGLQSIDVGRHRLYYCVPGYALGQTDLSKIRYVISTQDAAQIKFESSIQGTASGAIVQYTDEKGYQQQTSLGLVPAGQIVKQKTVIINLTGTTMTLANAEKARDLALADLQRKQALAEITVSYPVRDLFQAGRLCPIDEIEPGYLVALPSVDAANLSAQGDSDLRDGATIGLIDTVEMDVDGLKAKLTIDKPLNRLDRYLADLKK